MLHDDITAMMQYHHHDVTEEEEAPPQMLRQEKGAGQCNEGGCQKEGEVM